jgi:hypothetical protein
MNTEGVVDILWIMYHPERGNIKSLRFEVQSSKVNPVRKFLTFQRDGSHGALNPVFTPRGILSPSALQAAGLSNGVNLKGTSNHYRFVTPAQGGVQ